MMSDTVNANYARYMDEELNKQNYHGDNNCVKFHHRDFSLLPSAAKGACGKRVAEKALMDIGFLVTKAVSRGHDTRISIPTYIDDTKDDDFDSEAYTKELIRGHNDLILCDPSLCRKRVIRSLIKRTGWERSDAAQEYERVLEQLKHTPMTFINLEIKTSSKWETGNFKFQQIRESQDWEYICFVFVLPRATYIKWATRADLKNAGVFENGQHTGKNGKDTCWIDVKSSHDIPEYPEYFKELSELYEYLEKNQNNNFIKKHNN